MYYDIYICSVYIYMYNIKPNIENCNTVPAAAAEIIQLPIHILLYTRRRRMGRGWLTE